ncbi:hypothetical protein GCM10010521_49660 [Streptomyces rameus]|uniref:Uncharacterized protein n=1 Tax=Streptomyces rameus TaxID=68261 RepID=A0ABP6NSQ6_9ACTN
MDRRSDVFGSGGAVLGRSELVHHPDESDDTRQDRTDPLVIGVTGLSSRFEQPRPSGAPSPDGNKTAVIRVTRGRPGS